MMMFNNKCIFLFSLIIAVDGLVSNRKSFDQQLIKNFKHVNKIATISSTSLFIKTSSSTTSSAPTSTSTLIPFVNTQELTSRLDNMPLSEKYILLIESYTKDILQAKDNNKMNKSQLMESIESLYTEMIQQPNEFKTDAVKQATSSLLTSASFFFNTIQLAQAVQLAKAGRQLTYSLTQP